MKLRRKLPPQTRACCRGRWGANVALTIWIWVYSEWFRCENRAGSNKETGSRNLATYHTFSMLTVVLCWPKKSMYVIIFLPNESCLFLSVCNESPQINLRCMIASCPWLHQGTRYFTVGLEMSRAPPDRSRNEVQTSWLGFGWGRQHRMPRLPYTPCKGGSIPKVGHPRPFAYLDLPLLNAGMELIFNPLM